MRSENMDQFNTISEEQAEGDWWYYIWEAIKIVAIGSLIGIPVSLVVHLLTL